MKKLIEKLGQPTKDGNINIWVLSNGSIIRNWNHLKQFDYYTKDDEYVFSTGSAIKMINNLIQSGEVA